MSKDYRVKIQRDIAAPRKAVFEAWLKPESLKKFMKPAPEMPEPEITMDAQVGGKYTIIMKAGESELLHQGEYKSINRYSELSFTWLSSATIPDSLVKIQFEELSENETRLLLTHVGFPDEERRANHEGGWARILEHQASLMTELAAT